MMRYRLIFLILLIVLVVLGCQSTGPTVERLDTGSGITLSGVAEPLAFARTEARYSRTARDYVYLGPVEVNRQGRRDYFLWVGAGTTLDRGYLAPEQATPEVLLVSVRDELMALELAPWDERVPALGDPVIYAPTVKLTATLGARVSRQQLDLIAKESLESIRIVDTSGAVQSYWRWREGSEWTGLVADGP